MTDIHEMKHSLYFVKVTTFEDDDEDIVDEYGWHAHFIARDYGLFIDLRCDRCDDYDTNVTERAEVMLKPEEIQQLIKFLQREYPEGK